MMHTTKHIYGKASVPEDGMQGEAEWQFFIDDDPPTGSTLLIAAHSPIYVPILAQMGVNVDDLLNFAHSNGILAGSYGDFVPEEAKKGKKKAKK